MVLTADVHQEPILGLAWSKPALCISLFRRRGSRVSRCVSKFTR